MGVAREGEVRGREGRSVKCGKTSRSANKRTKSIKGIYIKVVPGGSPG